MMLRRKQQDKLEPLKLAIAKYGLSAISKAQPQGPFATTLDQLIVIEWPQLHTRCLRFAWQTPELGEKVPQS